MDAARGRFIDLHTHLLPGVDDGARDMDVSLAMARLAQADGIGHIVVTPHVPFCGLDVSALAKRLEALRGFLAQNQVELQLSLGTEVSLEPDMIQWLAEGMACPLGATRYVLAELPFFGYPPYVEDVIFQLQVKGYTPILAHPERNAELAATPARLGALVERGVLTQITTTSLLGGFGAATRNAAVEFLQRGWAHVLASDAHSATHRPPILSEGVRAAERIVGDQAWDLVTVNPAAILNGDEVESPRPVKKARRWPR
jgi:protein-tyrosine phosphatase